MAVNRLDFRRSAGFLCIALLLLAVHALVIVYIAPPDDETASAIVTLIENLLATACLGVAARRANGSSRVVWALSATGLLVWAAVNTCWLIRHTTDPLGPISALLAFSYRLYAVPLSFALFLKANDRIRSSPNLLLDALQTSLVVTLVFAGLFYVPTQHMSDHTRLVFATKLGDLINLMLLAAYSLRWRFEASRGMRRIYVRILFFLVAYTVVSLVGNRVELLPMSIHPRWIELFWSLPYLFAGVLAITWRPQSDDETILLVRNPFGSRVAENLVLALLVLAIDLLADSLEGAWHRWGNVAVALSILIYAFRLTSTQRSLEREVQDRQAAENDVRATHEQLEGLLAEAHSRENELQKLGELVRLVQSCLSEDEACAVIAEGVQHLLPESSGAVYSVSMLESAHVVASWGTEPPSASSFLLDQCWAARTTHIHSTIRNNSAVRCLHLTPEANRAAMCVPLRTQNELVGLMVLVCNHEQVSEGEPVPADLRRAKILLEAVAAHISPALTNLRLRQSLRDQAVRDSLTGLFNRRYMEETLDREVRRAIRRNRPLSVLMLDLDHFKRYNDRYGHAAGDTVLRRVGTFLHSRIRAEDIACRYGGEEFVVILPEATLEVAVQRAEEIRAGIKQLKIIHDARALDHITASIGLVSASAEISEGSSLLRAADVALYQSKENGRDRVTVAGGVLTSAHSFGASSED